MSMAEPMFCGSLPDGLALGSPGCSRVPSGYSLFQSLDDVPGPEPDSSTALPAIMTCFGSFGSTANCVENCADDELPASGGAIAFQVFPPSLVPLMIP